MLMMMRLTPSPSDTMTPTATATTTTHAGQRQRLLAFLGVFTLVGSVRAWTYSATTLFLPLLGSEIGLGAGAAAHLLTVFLAAGALGSLACGSASDRLGARRMVAGVLTLTIPLGPGVALIEPGGLALFALAAMSGFLLTGAYTGLTVAGQRQLPDNAGMVTGLNVGLTTGLGGLAVIPLAALADDIGLRTALSVALLLGPLAALAIWLPAGRTARRSSS
jgi:FSR family fosmidomycin resistance protein-like MFS transporter